MGDQRRILRQEKLLHGVLRHEVQPAIQLPTAPGTATGSIAGARSAASPYSGGYVEFPAGSVLEVRTAISYVGIEGARANLAAEGAASFGDVRAAASVRMERHAVTYRGGRPRCQQSATFYTSLYRSLLHPNTFNDADGRYIGFDSFVHTVAKGHIAVRQLLRLGHLPGPSGPTGLLFPSEPATWPNRWLTMPSRADRIRVGRWRIRRLAR